MLNDLFKSLREFLQCHDPVTIRIQRCTTQRRTNTSAQGFAREFDARLTRLRTRKATQWRGTNTDSSSRRTSRPRESSETGSLPDSRRNSRSCTNVRGTSGRRRKGTTRARSAREGATCALSDDAWWLCRQRTTCLVKACPPQVSQPPTFSRGEGGSHHTPPWTEGRRWARQPSRSHSAQLRRRERQRRAR